MPQPVVDQCSVSVFTEGQLAHVHIVVSGEVDLGTWPLLSEALRHVAERMPGAVYVDLAGVTFAGATLANFVFQVRRALPRASTVVLCRPAPPVHWVLQAADVPRVATIRADVPVCR